MSAFYPKGIKYDCKLAKSSEHRFVAQIAQHRFKSIRLSVIFPILSTFFYQNEAVAVWCCSLTC